MDNKPSKSNTAVIASLDSLKDFASKYEDRINIQCEEEKKKDDSFVKEYLKNNKNISIQEEIARTLRQAKLKEEEKRKLEAEKLKNKRELENINRATVDFITGEFDEMMKYEDVVGQYVEELVRMEKLEKETNLIIEREERKREEKQRLLENCRLLEAERAREAEEKRRLAEREMKERIMAELQSLQEMENMSTQKIKKAEKEKKTCQIQTNLTEKHETNWEERRKAAEKVKLVEEEAKRMTFTAAMKDFVKQKVNKKTVEPKESPAVVLKDEKYESVNEENHNEKLRKIIEDDKRRSEEILQRRRQEEEFYKALRNEAELRRTEFYEEMRKEEHRNKINSLANCPIESKQINLNNIDFEKKINRSVLLPLLARFEQLSRINLQEKILTEKINKNQKRKYNFKKRSKQMLNKIVSNLRRNDELPKAVESKEEEAENQQDIMKNYLLSKVLFDQEENLKSVSKNPTEVKLSSMTNELEMEQKHFATYKQNMEEYLDFVCSPDELKIKKETESNLQNFVKPSSSNHVKEMKEKLQHEKVEKKLSTVPEKLSSSKLLFTNQNKTAGKNNQQASVIDRGTFEKTRQQWNNLGKEENLSHIQERKNEIVLEIKQELEAINSQIGSDQDQDIQSDDEQTKEVEKVKEEEKEEEYVPKWIQVFLDRTNEKNIPSTFGSTFDSREEKERSIDEETGRIETGEVTGAGSGGEDKLTQEKREPGVFKTKIEKLKDLFASSRCSSEAEFRDKLRIPPMAGTQDRRTKLEARSKGDEKPSKLGLERPKKKIIDVSSITELCSDSVDKNILNKQEFKWKMKTKESDLTKFSTSQEVIAINSNLEVEDSSEEIETDLTRMSEYAKNIQSYIDLISDEPLSSKQDSKTEKNCKLNKISRIDRNYIENTFVDSNKRKPALTKMNIGKLSKSLTFLNEPSEHDDSIRKPKNKDNLKITNIDRKKVDLFDTNLTSPVKEEDVKTKVKKKLFEDPWKTICQETQNHLLSDRKGKVWKAPKPKPANSLEYPPLQDREHLTVLDDHDHNTKEIIRSDSMNIKSPRNYEEDDLDDILNYEHSEEIKQYEEQLKSEYREAYDTDNFDPDPKVRRSDLKKSDSFASLMNILSTMRKSNLAKSVSASRLNLMQNMVKKDICSEDSTSLIKPNVCEVNVAERREFMEKIDARKEITNKNEEVSEIKKLRKVKLCYKI